MTKNPRWEEAAPTASSPAFATSPDKALHPYNGDLGFASRHLIRRFRISPVLAPTVASLAGVRGGL